MFADKIFINITAFDNVISNVTGVSGMAILDSIIAGERDPKNLADLRDPRVRASKKTIAKSLVGDYRSEHIFTLKQELQTYRYYRQMIKDCDIEIENSLKEFDSKIDIDLSPPKGKRPKPRGNEPDFDLKSHMYRLLGTDLTLIDGVSSMTAHTFFTEVGPDLSKFRTSRHFCSWLGLCPNNQISGGRILKSKTRPGSNRAAQALRLSARSLLRSKSFLGNYYRKMRTRHGSPKAITATAHKLARIIYHLVKNQKQFDQSVFAEQEKDYQGQVKKRLLKQAKALGLVLVPA